MCRSTASPAPAWARSSAAATRPGYRPRSSRHFLVGIDWKKVVGSQGRRDLEPIEQKRAGPTYSNELEFGITREWRHDTWRSDQYEQRRRSAARLCRERTARDGLRQAADSVPCRRDRHGLEQHGRARSGRSRDRDARQHGDSRRLRARRDGQHDPVGRRTRSQHSDRHRAQSVCRRGHRREPRRARGRSAQAADRTAAAHPLDGRHDHCERRAATCNAATWRCPHRRRNGFDRHGRFRARAGHRAARRSGSPQDVQRTREVRGSRDAVSSPGERALHSRRR